ncbi:MAG: hypothetical protein KAQ66_05765, partial [Rhodospirillaceae bacterium]|nr:hypothetical protein [Rhodospirillaceae bacterium]
GKINFESGANSGSENAIADNFIKTLEQSDFFNQMSNLKESLAGFAGELSTVGTSVNQRAEEAETIAAHVMAIEAVLAVMLKNIPLDPEAVKAEVISRSQALSGNPEGSPTVQAVARDIIGG